MPFRLRTAIYEEANFERQINGIAATGPTLQNFRFRFTENCGLTSDIPSHWRGASRPSRALGWNAVDAAALLDERRGLRTAKACGSGTPGLVLSAQGDDLRATVTMRSRTPGRARKKS